MLLGNIMKTHQVKGNYNPDDFERIKRDILENNLLDRFFLKDIGFKWSAYSHKECYTSTTGYQRYYLWDKASKAIFCNYKWRNEFFDCLKKYIPETIFFKNMEERYRSNLIVKDD